MQLHDFPYWKYMKDVSMANEEGSDAGGIRWQMSYEVNELQRDGMQLLEWQTRCRL